MGLRQRLATLCVRLAAILMVAGVLLVLPDPNSGDVVRYKNALVVLISLVLVGKSLFDTFFYDRYR
ncbi:MAG TPA: hypothetical protein VFB21_24860 [Chthonomonadaceae bacterium]|nr:hypothetical protein [Chthonomonadaceae bacterium]